jgi:uncharacterized repeat protein (TIGR01451 family)
MKRIRNFLNVDSGQSITETALVIPIFLLLVWGVFEFGRIVFTFSSLNNASREAARFGAAVGLTANNIPNYLDCAAIREHTRNTAFLTGLQDSEIQIAYDTPVTSTQNMTIFAQCGDPDLDSSDIKQGDRIVVTVTRNIKPLLPILPLPTFNPTFVTARTILKDIIIGPLECSDDVDNDGDGTIDFDGGPNGEPADPGCSGPNDTTEAICYSLSVVGSPPEGGSLSIVPNANCANRYIENTVVSLGAFPAELYTFRRWSGDASGTMTTTQVTMDSDKDVVAEFRRLTSELSVAKGDAPDPVGSNELLTYSIVVNNTFSDTAHNVLITDTLTSGVVVDSYNFPAGTCTVNGIQVLCSAAELLSGNQLNLTIVVTAPVANYNDRIITNTVTVSADEDDPVNNNTAVALTTVEPRIDLRMINKVDSEDPVYADTNFDYTITVSNDGPSIATGVEIDDPLPTGMSFVSSADGCVFQPPDTVICPLADIPAGASQSATFTVNAPSSGGQITNTATVTANEVDNIPGNNEISEGTLIISHANLNLNKSAPATAYRDAPFDYTLTVNNPGPSTATNVVITDTLPANMLFNGFSGASSCTLQPDGVTVLCNLGAMAKNDSRVVTLNVTPLMDSGTILNTATVGSDIEDRNLSNNTDDATTTISTDVQLTINKTAPTIAGEGDTIAYTIAMNNSGQSNATGVVLEDVLPPEVSFSSFGTNAWNCNPPSGQLITCTPPTGEFLAGTGTVVTIYVTANDVDVSTDVTNNATLNTNEGSVSDGATTTINPSLKVSITGPETATQDVPFDYTVLVVNSGSTDAAGVALTIVLDATLTNIAVTAGGNWTCNPPSGQQVTCSLATLAAGNSSAPITITVTPTTAVTVTSTATVTSPFTDTDTHDTEILPP